MTIVSGRYHETVEVSKLSVVNLYPESKQSSLDTKDAKRYLLRLCKHFQHKVPTQWTEADALITFEEGICMLKANEDSLWMRCEADNQHDLREITDTIDRHLAVFVRDDSFALNWATVN